MSIRPEFPITVRFHETGVEWTFGSIDELACDLISLNSDDPNENTSVTDARGRAVRLRVNALEVELFVLASKPSCALEK